MMSEPIAVEAFKDDSRMVPRAFYLSGRRLKVLDLGRSWREQGRQHWLVRTKPSQVYELIYVEAEERWLLGRTPADFQTRGPVA